MTKAGGRRRHHEADVAEDNVARVGHRDDGRDHVGGRGGGEALAGHCNPAIGDDARAARTGRPAARRHRHALHDARDHRHRIAADDRKAGIGRRQHQRVWQHIVGIRGSKVKLTDGRRGVERLARRHDLKGPRQRRDRVVGPPKRLRPCGERAHGARGARRRCTAGTHEDGLREQAVHAVAVGVELAGIVEGIGGARRRRHADHAAARALPLAGRTDAHATCNRAGAADRHARARRGGRAAAGRNIVARAVAVVVDAVAELRRRQAGRADEPLYAGAADAKAGAAGAQDCYVGGIDGAVVSKAGHRLIARAVAVVVVAVADLGLGGVHAVLRVVAVVAEGARAQHPHRLAVGPVERVDGRHAAAVAVKEQVAIRRVRIAMTVCIAVAHAERGAAVDRRLAAVGRRRRAAAVGPRLGVVAGGLAGREGAEAATGAHHLAGAGRRCIANAFASAAGGEAAVAVLGTIDQCAVLVGHAHLLAVVRDAVAVGIEVGAAGAGEGMVGLGRIEVALGIAVVAIDRRGAARGEAGAHTHAIFVAVHAGATATCDGEAEGALFGGAEHLVARAGQAAGEAAGAAVGGRRVAGHKAASRAGIGILAGVGCVVEAGGAALAGLCRGAAVAEVGREGRGPLEGRAADGGIDGAGGQLRGVGHKGEPGRRIGRGAGVDELAAPGGGLVAHAERLTEVGMVGAAAAADARLAHGDALKAGQAAHRHHVARRTGRRPVEGKLRHTDAHAVGAVHVDVAEGEVGEGERTLRAGAVVGIEGEHVGRIHAGVVVDGIGLGVVVCGVGRGVGRRRGSARVFGERVAAGRLFSAGCEQRERQQQQGRRATERAEGRTRRREVLKSEERPHDGSRRGAGSEEIQWRR